MTIVESRSGATYVKKTPLFAFRAESVIRQYGTVLHDDSLTRSPLQTDTFGCDKGVFC